MATRKVKHARALANREEFFKAVYERDQKVLRKVRDQREEEKKRIDKQEQDRKIAKSKRLAESFAAKPKAPNKKKEN